MKDEIKKSREKVKDKEKFFSFTCKDDDYIKMKPE